MKHLLSTNAIVAVLSVGIACSSSSPSAAPAGTDDAGSDDTANPRTTSNSKDSEEEQVGHVFYYGVGASGTAPATIFATARFSRPTEDEPACGTSTIDGCKVQANPACDAACAEGESCYWTEACKSVCAVPPTSSCAPGSSPRLSAGGEWSCKSIGDFLDAGVVTISRSGESFSMSVGDYATSAGATEPAFETDAAYSVNAKGTSEVSAFKGTLKTPRALNSNVSSAPKSLLESGTSFEATWEADSDAVTVYAFGALGSASCKATDSKGGFTLSAKVLDAVRGDAAKYLSVYVSRVRETRVSGVNLSGSGWKQTGFVGLMSTRTENSTVRK